MPTVHGKLHPWTAESYRPTRLNTAHEEVEKLNLFEVGLACKICDEIVLGVAGIRLK